MQTAISRYAVTLQHFIRLLFLITAPAFAYSAERHYQVVKRIPHDPQAYTQGLLFDGGYFFESTGLYGQSSLRRLDPETGKVLQRFDLPRAFFGEGLALFEDRLIQITWREGAAIVYQRDTFKPLRGFRYEAEGWGLTHNGRHLIMSDGSPRIYFRDPEDFSIARTLTVTHNGKPVPYLNELEYIENEIWANIYQTDYIAIIDPLTGRVKKLLNFAGLIAPHERNGREDVLNGIAYDADKKRLFITGKRYSYIYQVELNANSD